MQFYLKLVLLSNLIIWPAISFAGQSQTDLTQNTYQNLSEENKDYWYKLLHAEYFKGKSKLDGEKFFLSPHGKESPSLELTATINAFKNKNKMAGWFNYPVQCVFRERYEFLKRVGYLEGVEATPCPMFDEWKNGLNADSATLVFSSSYPNNPSSLFGHTLIRLNQKNKASDLLDYSISFSALPDGDDIGLVFAFKGIFGGYKGLIEVTKYYTKVMEYNSSESRDLLEYDLNLTKVQLDRLINHVWEIYQTTYADYYFLDENCSSVLADILAVALHEYDGVNTHSRWYYLPSEMVKRLMAEKDLVKSFKLRPSLKKQLEKKLDNLTIDEKKSLDQIISKHDLSKDFNDILVLDVLISYLDYRRYRSRNSLSEGEKKLLRLALIRRSNIKEESKEYTGFSETNRPELGHETKYWQTFLRTENSHSLVGFTFKNGYHNLMDRDLGYDPYSQFDFLSGTIVYDKKLNRFNYDNFNFIHLTSLHPFKFYDPQFSWNVAILGDRFYQNSCDLCHQVDLVASGGFSGSLTKNDRINFFAGVFSELNEHVAKGYRVGPLVELSYLISFKDQIKLGLFSEERFSVIKKLSENYQNLSKVKFHYFPSINNEISLEYKQISKFGSFKSDTSIYSVGYGQHF